MEVRRSTRANRGVNPALGDDFYEGDQIDTVLSSVAPRTAVKEPKSDKLKHDPALTEEEEVRCLVCGLWQGNYNEDEPSDAKFDNWIECGRCKLWQHTYCMFGKANAKVPEDYKCDVCDPNNARYAKIKRKMAYDRWLKLRFPDGNTGVAEDQISDDLLEEDLDAFEGADDDDKYVENDDEEEDELDANLEDEDDDINDRALEEPESVEREPIAEEEQDDDEEVIVRPKAVRKAEVFKENRPKRAAVTKKQTLVKRAKVSSAMQSKRDGIIRGFSSVLGKLIPVDDVELLKGRSVADLALEWSKELEAPVFDMYHGVDPQYTGKCRSLLQNIKGNHLVERVIAGEFEMRQLPLLTNEEMKTKEEKERDQRIREKELSKSVIKTSINTVPQVKITHKGEEVLENADYQFDDPTSSYVNDKRLEEVEKIKDELAEKRRESKRESVTEDQTLRNVFHAHAAGFDEYEDNREEEMDEENADEYEGASEAENEGRDLDDDDDFDNILNGTASAEPEAAVGESAHLQELPYEPTYEPTLEPDYEPTPDSHPPVEFTKVWQGMTELGFGAFATDVTFVASSDPKGDDVKAKRIFEDLVKIKGKVSLDGRLSASVADAYLAKIGQTRYFYLYEIRSGDVLFAKSWRFYCEKRKYGVVGQKPSYVKDVYLIANDRDGLVERRAEFFSKLDFDLLNESIVAGSKEKLYVVFVVSKGVEFDEGDDYEPSATPPPQVAVNSSVSVPAPAPAPAAAQLQSILDSLKG